MKYVVLFLLALVLSGTVTVSQVSKANTTPDNLTQRKEVKVSGNAGFAPDVASMSTIAENLANQTDSMTLEMPVSYYVLPIPEEKLNLVGYWSFEIPITNNTDAPIFIGDGILTPELISPDGEQIKLQVGRDRRFYQKNYCLLLARGETGALSSFGGLFLQNNSLQLRGRLGGEKFWYFNDLSPGTYQMRLLYDAPGGELSCYEIGSGDPIFVEGVGKATGITNFIPIRIVPVKYINNNTIKIDGIEFEIVMPKRVFAIPVEGKVTDIEVGLKITNKTTKPVRFSRYKTLYLEVIAEDSQPLKVSDGRLPLFPAREEDNPLLQPSESTIFWRENKIFWRNNRLVWRGADKFGGHWFFENEIAPGKYQMQLQYSPTRMSISYVQGIQEKTPRPFKDWWAGVAATPFVEFQVVRP